MPLLPNFNLDQIIEWINENIVGTMTPINGNVTLVPTNKGIYFWFMRPNGYDVLNANLGNTSLFPVEPRMEREERHLVYIGTAGTGKNGGGHLQQRLKWHICQTHSESCIKHGTISTLRAGIGSLLSDDLIECPPSSTQQKVNTFLEEYFMVYWITYNLEQEMYIENDEAILIDKLRPLFNIKGNSNSRIENHPTKTYNLRRKLILTQTKYRVIQQA